MAELSQLPSHFAFRRACSSGLRSRHPEHGHYLRIYMGKLRHRLEDDPARPRYFLTETGIGYRFSP